MFFPHPIFVTFSAGTQMRGFLQMKASDFAGSVIPKKGLSSLVIDQGVRALTLKKTGFQ